MPGFLHKSLVVLLLLLGISILIYRNQVLNFPLVPQQDTNVWAVEARIKVDADGGPVKVTMPIPNEPRGFLVLDEDFTSPGYGLTIQTDGPNRHAVWATREANGEDVLYYRLNIAKWNGDNGEIDQPEIRKVAVYEEPYAAAANVLLKEMHEVSADVSSFSSALLQELLSPDPGEEAELLLNNTTDREEVAEIAVQLLAQADIPARVIYGIYLQKGDAPLELVPLLEVYTEQDWLCYDLTNAEPGLPEDFLIWKRGPGAVVNVSGSAKYELSFSALKQVRSTMNIAQSKARLTDSMLHRFSLQILPIHVQNVYQVLLLVPIGALIISLLRNIIGLTTLGTFMPVLIALSFRETNLVAGVVLFSVVVLLGLLVRSALSRLNLLLVPRIAAVVVIVIILMGLISIFSHHLGMERPLSVALFPMVILAWTIERMSKIWEEEGGNAAMKIGLQSLVAAAIAYPAMDNPYTMHFMFTFPESLFIILAILLMLGRYTNYRLTELRRFRDTADAS